jgi:hypothetical protein
MFQQIKIVFLSTVIFFATGPLFLKTSYLFVYFNRPNAHTIAGIRHVDTGRNSDITHDTDNTRDN